VRRGPERTREYRNHHLDSTRWDGFTPRDDDIFITTAYKAGTTWTQRIVAALVFAGEPLPQSLGELSPWVDARFVEPVEPVLEKLEAQRHRRFIKSHLAADGLRYFPEAKYLVVGRDTRDVFMSLFNHYSGYTDLMYSLVNDPARPGPEFPRCPATPRELWPRWIGEGWFEWEPDGWPMWSHHHHLSTWWEFRDVPNILFVHFGDLKADPEAEMRRIAAFCDIEVDEAKWPALVTSVGLEEMRREARNSPAHETMSFVFEGGADRFFYRGDNGRWRGVLTDDDLARYDAAAATLDPDLRRWLEGGRHAVGV
jgi:aryl sulfotransferase